MIQPVAPEDLGAVTAQLGRPVRAVQAVAHRCGCGRPDVVRTQPKLPDGTPFPTLYYLTCPRATAAVSTLESEGLMRELTRRLADEPELARAQRAAHEAYLAEREGLGRVQRIEGISAGGMPDRVKCLHVLAAHSLGAGAGVNRLGDEVLEVLRARGIGPDTMWGGTTAGCLAERA